MWFYSSPKKNWERNWERTRKGDRKELLILWIVPLKSHFAWRAIAFTSKMKIHVSAKKVDNKKNRIFPIWCSLYIKRQIYICGINLGSSATSGSFLYPQPCVQRGFYTVSSHVSANRLDGNSVFTSGFVASVLR